MKITEENFIDQDPAVLLQPGSYEQVEDMILSIDAAQTPDYSRQYAVMLESKLGAVANSMPKDVFKRYLRLFKVLRLHGLLEVSDAEKEKFFRDGILDTLRLDFVNARYWVEFCFRAFYASPDIIEQYRKIFLSGLENNIELLGQAELRLPGQERTVPPTLKNWLFDYNSATADAVLRKNRGRLEQGKYLTSSPRVQTLSLEDRKVLLRVLELYDWLRFSELKYDFSFPGQPQPQEQILEGQQVLIPQELANLINNLRGFGAKPKAAPPPPPARTPAGPDGTVGAGGLPPAPAPRASAGGRITFAPVPKPQPVKPVDGVASFTRAEQKTRQERMLQDQKQALAEIAKIEPVAKPTGFSAAVLSKMSLSQAIANADQDTLSQVGKIRVGRELPPPAPPQTVSPRMSAPPPPAPPKQVSPRPPAPPPSALSPKPTVTPSRIEPAKPPVPRIVNLEGNISIKTPSVPGPKEVVDLSKRPVLKVASMRRPEELAKLQVEDVAQGNFNEWLQLLKDRMVELAREFSLPLKNVTAHFYRSPLFALYGAMAVAVMNDTTSPDQAAAYEKIVKNYQQAQKAYLTREQFLALGWLKKELSTMESTSK